MHTKAKQWDALYAKVFELIGAPMGRPCDRCGEPVTMGFIHTHCMWAELEALNKEASARAAHRKQYGSGRPGTTVRIYKKYAKEALTPESPESKFMGNKESSHEAISLSPEGQ